MGICLLLYFLALAGNLFSGFRCGSGAHLLFFLIFRGLFPFFLPYPPDEQTDHQKYQQCGRQEEKKHEENVVLKKK